MTVDRFSNAFYGLPAIEFLLEKGMRMYVKQKLILLLLPDYAPAVELLQKIAALL